VLIEFVRQRCCNFAHRQHTGNVGKFIPKPLRFLLRPAAPLALDQQMRDKKSLCQDEYHDTDDDSFVILPA
jgi:hypothetical protein